MAVAEKCIMFIELTTAIKPSVLAEDQCSSRIALAQAWTANRQAGWDIRMQLMSEDDYQTYQGP